MKPSFKLAALLVAGPIVGAACAKGSTDDGTMLADITSTAEPTEPSGEADEVDSRPIPPAPSSDAAADGSMSDAGASDDAGKPSTQTDAGDAGTKPPAGSCTTAPPSNKCGLTPQCGCATGETCDVTNKTSGSVSCIKAGSSAQGTPCKTSTQCATGLTCAYGSCRPYCPKTGASCTATGGKCMPFYEQDKAVPNTQVCSVTCDLMNPKAACGTNTCIWDPTFGTTDCDQAGTLGAFEPCSKYNECKPGLACVNTLLWAECEPWCRIGTTGDCPSPTTCVDVHGTKAPTQGTTRYGNCR